MMNSLCELMSCEVEPFKTKDVKGQQRNLSSCCYNEKFVTAFLFFLRSPSVKVFGKCLFCNSGGDAGLEARSRVVAGLWMVGRGAEWAAYSECGSKPTTLLFWQSTAALSFPLHRCLSIYLLVCVCVCAHVYPCVCRRDKRTGSSLLWDWCLYQTIITSLAVFSVSLKFDTV